MTTKSGTLTSGCFADWCPEKESLSTSIDVNHGDNKESNQCKDNDWYCYLLRSKLQFLLDHYYFDWRFCPWIFEPIWQNCLLIESASNGGIKREICPNWTKKHYTTKKVREAKLFKSLLNAALLMFIITYLRETIWGDCGCQQDSKGDQNNKTFSFFAWWIQFEHGSLFWVELRVSTTFHPKLLL